MDVIEFIYNAEGTRTEKKVNGVSTYYQYDANGNIVLETDSQKNIKVKYIRDTEGKTLAQEQNNQTYYYLYNAHGDVTGLTDSQGNVVATYTYDEFGNLKSSTGSIYNPLRYSGANNAYYDSETGLYKMGVRYYDSSIGRWLTRDKYEGEQENQLSQNRYVYTQNDPLNNVDPTGFAAWSSRRRINKSDRFAYRKFIKNHYRDYYGSNYGDCADLAIQVLVDFAVRHKVSIKLYAENGTGYDSNSYSSKDEYLRYAKAYISAAALGKKNSKALKYWKSAARGDLLIFHWGGASWDTKIITANTVVKKKKKKKRRYWYIHENPGAIVDHGYLWISDPVMKSLYGKRARRWNWQ